MDDELNEASHYTIKEQLPFCSKAQAVKFGSFYFKAWKSADEEAKKEIEESYLQELVHFAIYGQPALVQRLRNVLEPFVNQKRLKAVDSLLFRLLQPVIWRGLMAINRTVRANAVNLFIFVFPMVNREGRSQENSEILQKQMEVLETFLVDPVPTIRVSAIIGICRICDAFWELIPLNVLKTLFTILVDRLAFDVTSVDCRFSVCKFVQGFAMILENPLSHNVLEKVLPHLAMCLHDKAEKVRIAFVKLLEKVKGLKTIKYWHIVSMDHILARLADENSLTVQKLLVQLVANSFCPTDQTHEGQLQRCIVLIEKNGDAARKLYRLVSEHLPSPDVAVEHILLLLRCVYSCVRQKKKENENSNLLENSDAISDETSVSVQGINVENRLTLDNRAVICGLLECGAILWHSVGRQLHSDNHKDSLKRLVKISSKIVQECFTFFEDVRINNILLYYASLLPASSTPYLAATSVKKLKCFDDIDAVDSTVFGSLLEAACFWRFKEIADMIVIWLDLCADLDRTCSTICPSPPVPKRSRRVKFTANKSVDSPVPEAKPRLGLLYLEFLLSNAQCRSYLLHSQRPQLKRLSEKLNRFLQKCFNYVRNDEVVSDKIGMKETLLASRLQCSIQMLLTSDKSEQASIDETSEFFIGKTVFYEQHVLPMLEEDGENVKLNGEKFLLQFFNDCRHLLMTNLVNDGFIIAFCQFLTKCVNECSDSHFDIVCRTSFAFYAVVDNLSNRDGHTIRMETVIVPLINLWFKKFTSFMQSVNDFTRDNEIPWKSSVEAALETFHILSDDVNDAGLVALANECRQSLVDIVAGWATKKN